MRAFIGIKLVFAEPENRYGREGFKVVYPADGYESWSPYSAFMNAYKPIAEMAGGQEPTVSEYASGIVSIRPPVDPVREHYRDKEQDTTGQYRAEGVQDWDAPCTTEGGFEVHERRVQAMSLALQYVGATAHVMPARTITAVLAHAAEIEGYLRDGTPFAAPQTRD